MKECFSLRNKFLEHYFEKKINKTIIKKIFLTDFK